MKIIFLNTWGGKQRDEMTAFLIEHTPTTDVFCFQEFYNDMPSIAETVLQEFKVAISVQKKSPQENAPLMSQGIFARTSIQLLATDQLLSEQDGTGFAAYALVEIDGKQFHICNVYGIPWPGTKLDTPERLKQSNGILAFLADKQGPKIIAGDFNLFPETESVRMFETAGYRNLIKDYSIPTTRNHLSWDRFPTKQLWADFAFVTPDIEVKAFSVPEACEASDHLPLILEIA